jgi:uncharacterized coiled-coil DUF342 family protein
MNRFWHMVNFMGVIALVALCWVQWGENRTVSRRAVAAETSRAELQIKLQDAQHTIDADKKDLDEFRDRLTQAQKDIEKNKADLTEAVAQQETLRTERDLYHTNALALQTALEKWKAALAERENALNQANDAVVKIAADRNDAVKKLNALVTNYNTGIKSTNDQLQQMATDRNEAVQRFNDLAAKYNALIQGGSTSTKP